MGRGHTARSASTRSCRKLTLLWEVGEIHPHPLWNGEELTWMGTRLQVKCWVAGIGGDDRMKKHLNPACLDMPIFKSTDPNTDVTYTSWRFDMQGWLDQYDESIMIPHIFSSLQGYPGKWACSLPEGSNISVPDLLACMDCMFGNVCNYNTMIRSLYEIRQKE